MQTLKTNAHNARKMDTRSYKTDLLANNVNIHMDAGRSVQGK